jgi:hypothetical protein
MTGNARVSAVKRSVQLGKTVSFKPGPNDGMLIKLFSEDGKEEKTFIDKDVAGMVIQNSAFDALVEYVNEGKSDE